MKKKLEMKPNKHKKFVKQSVSFMFHEVNQCFDTVGWVIWPVKPVRDMTYNVFGGTLSLTQSV